MDINLNIFTNSIQTAPDINIIRQTYQSFCDTFGEIPTTIYCDSHPNTAKFPEYFKNLKEYFKNCEVIHTNSLSDGYLKSIKNSTANYLFQLEGDWIFNGNINHSLQELIKIMYKNSIYHLRFNKRANIRAGWDTIFNPAEIDGFKCCISNNMSNNPHIIDRNRYITEIIDDIKLKQGSKGIEEELNARKKYFSCLYGPENYPATVTHLDGRKSGVQ